MGTNSALGCLGASNWSTLSSSINKIREPLLEYVYFFYLETFKISIVYNKFKLLIIYNMVPLKEPNVCVINGKYITVMTMPVIMMRIITASLVLLVIIKTISLTAKKNVAWLNYIHTAC